MAQWVVDLEAQLPSRDFQCDAPHVTKKHLHRDLRVRMGRMRRESSASSRTARRCARRFDVVCEICLLEVEPVCVIVGTPKTESIVF